MARKLCTSPPCVLFRYRAPSQCQYHHYKHPLQAVWIIVRHFNQTWFSSSIFLCLQTSAWGVSRSRVIQVGGTFFFLSFEDTLVIPIFLRSCYTFFCNRENERLKKVHPCQKGDNVDLPKNNESNFDDEGNFCQQEKARSFNLCTSGVLTFEEKWKIASSAVFWRKVILVIFVIFELGPDSESLCNALPSESISCGIWAFFQPRYCFWSFWPQK